MEIDKRVESLESEFKLMRGELKQTLTSVRDHLLNLKLPPSQEAAMLAAAMSEGRKGMSMDGRFSIERGERSVRSVRSVRGERGTDILEPPPETNEMPGEQAAEGDESLEPEAELSEQLEQPDEPNESNESMEGDAIGDDAMEDEATMESIETGRQLSQDTPPVNLLANLIRWVSSAKREIGSEQLATFLEVYGISGHLSQELKEVILHLADITATESADASAAEIWSELILELHGILAGGSASLRPFGPLWNNGGRDARRAEADKPKPKPSKLKLVLSSGDGEDKEFSLDLKPDEE